MLAYFLRTRRNTVASLVNAERSGAATVQTHAWLELAGDVIDITADQFATWDGAAPYVGPRTPWHAQWDVVSCRPFTSCDTTQMLATWLYQYELTLAALACPARARPWARVHRA